MAASKEVVQYLDSYSICCPGNPEKAVAKYPNGVLKSQYLINKLLFQKLVDVKMRNVTI